jgi:Tfp pilus assembly protein PilV
MSQRLVGMRGGRRGRCPSRGGERGFTLVEVGVALTVFMIGALSLALVMPLATRRVERAMSQSRASQFASQRAERVLMTPCTDDELAAGEHADPANPRDGLYLVRWVVEDDQPIAACKRITVDVARDSLRAPPIARIVVVVPRAGLATP